MAGAESLASVDRALWTSTSGEVLAWTIWTVIKRRNAGNNKENLKFMGASRLKDMSQGMGSGSFGVRSGEWGCLGDWDSALWVVKYYFWKSWY
jgi:hypothetical protein